MTDLLTRLEAMLTPNADGLLPCPNQWCHGIDIVHGEDSAGYKSLECRDCGCGSRDTDEMTAIAAWNSRPILRTLVEAIRQRDELAEELEGNQLALDHGKRTADAALLAIIDGKEAT